MFFTTAAEEAAKYADEVVREHLSAELDPELKTIAEKQARASHEGWMAGKIAQGYVYGPVTNDDPKKGQLTNPLLIPYDELDEATKQSNIANAVAVIRIMRDKGCTFVNFTKDILNSIAEQLHDAWSREKIAAGWKWGPETDKTKKIHRDLVPFRVLTTTPELQGDIVFDVDTARQIIINMILQDVFPVIASLANFALDTSSCPA